MIPQVISPPRPLQPTAHSSPCIAVPRGCMGAALTRVVQVAGAEKGGGGGGGGGRGKGGGAAAAAGGRGGGRLATTP